jgi:hypothetical protein
MVSIIGTLGLPSPLPPGLEVKLETKLDGGAGNKSTIGLITVSKNVASYTELLLLGSPVDASSVASEAEEMMEIIDGRREGSTPGGVSVSVLEPDSDDDDDRGKDVGDDGLESDEASDGAERRNGPVNAGSTCSAVAPKISRSLSSSDKARKRLSLALGGEEKKDIDGDVGDGEGDQNEAD